MHPQNKDSSVNQRTQITKFWITFVNYIIAFLFQIVKAFLRQILEMAQKWAEIGLEWTEHCTFNLPKNLIQCGNKWKMKLRWFSDWEPIKEILSGGRRRDLNKQEGMNLVWTEDVTSSGPINRANIDFALNLVSSKSVGDPLNGFLERINHYASGWKQATFVMPLPERVIEPVGYCWILRNLTLRFTFLACLN